MLTKYILVAVSSTIKFVGGPLLGISSGLNIFETAIFSMLGMMFTVTSLSYFGGLLRVKVLDKYLKKKRKFTAKNRRLVIIWKKYGLYGIAFFTPLILTPPVGTLIALSFGERPLKIILFMWVSAALWSFILSLIIHSLGQQFVLNIIRT